MYHGFSKKSCNNCLQMIIIELLAKDHQMTLILNKLRLYTLSMNQIDLLINH